MKGGVVEVEERAPWAEMLDVEEHQGPQVLAGAVGASFLDWERTASRRRRGEEEGVGGQAQAEAAEAEVATSRQWQDRSSWGAADVGAAPHLQGRLAPQALPPWGLLLQPWQLLTVLGALFLHLLAFASSTGQSTTSGRPHT